MHINSALAVSLLICRITKVAMDSGSLKTGKRPLDRARVKVLTCTLEGINQHDATHSHAKTLMVR